jgi:branched-chain amino acid transport system ATP-binding protein
MTTLLQAQGLRKSFAGVHAVAGADFSVQEGSITGLIGPNGAGKTTTFDLVAGSVAVDSGRVSFAGRDITSWSADRVARAGLLRTFQIPRTFNRMTVWENLLFAGDRHPGEHLLVGMFAAPGTRRREREIRSRAGEVLEFLQIEHVADDAAGTLSGGQRKLLELGRALMQRPRMLLLDEPFAGVAPALRREISDLLRTLQQQGHTILLIEHDLDAVMRLVDHLVVMHLGSVLVAGEPHAVRNDERVLEAYLGGRHG